MPWSYAQMLAAKFPHGEYLEIPSAGNFRVAVEAVAYPKGTKAWGLHVYLRSKVTMQKHWLWVGRWAAGKESLFYLFFKESFPPPTGSPDAEAPEILATIDMRSTKTGAIYPRLIKIHVLTGPYAGTMI